MPGALGELLCGATRPDRLADASRRAALGQQRQDEVGPRRDDPRRVASDRLHVGELQERVPRRQGVAEELEPVLRHHHQDGLARRQAAFDVRDGALQVLVVPRVEERFVPERRGSNWYFGERAHGSLRLPVGRPRTRTPEGATMSRCRCSPTGSGRSTRPRTTCCCGPGSATGSPKRTSSWRGTRAARRRPPLVAPDGPRCGRHDHRRRGRARAGHVLLVPVRGGRRAVPGGAHPHAAGPGASTVPARPRRAAPATRSPRSACTGPWPSARSTSWCTSATTSTRTPGTRGRAPTSRPTPRVTLDDYRRRIAQIRADPDTQALHQRHPVTTIWDDHDLSDNAWRTGAKHHDPERARSVGCPGAGRRAGPARVVARPLGRPVRSARHLAFAGGRRPRRAGPPRHPLRGTGPPGRRRRGPRRSTTRTAPCSATRNEAGWRSGCARPSSRGPWCSAASSSTSWSCPGRVRSRRSTRCCRTATRCSTAGSCTTTSGTATRRSAAA